MQEAAAAAFVGEAARRRGPDRKALYSWDFPSHQALAGAGRKCTLGASVVTRKFDRASAEIAWLGLPAARSPIRATPESGPPEFPLDPVRR